MKLIIRKVKRIYLCLLLLAVLAAAALITFDKDLIETTSAQQISQNTNTIFRVGEKLTYSISFGKIQNAGYAETHVVSRGKISGKDAVELRGRVKTIDLVSAAFLLLDESRTTFAAPDSAIPHYIMTSSLDSVMPKEQIRNFLARPTSNFDLLSLIYKAREAGGIGSFPLSEGEQMHTVSFQGMTSEKVRTEAGDFDTTVSLVASEFLTANGIKELKINFTNDDLKIPVLFRLKIGKNEFRAQLASISVPEPEVATPSPTPTPTPATRATPAGRPSPTPLAYVDNQPLIPELGFQLGEVLEYRISTGGKTLGTLALNARQRKLFEKADSLLLTAAITGIEGENNIFKLGDSASVYVDPETLAPIKIESKFPQGFAGLNQTVAFDQKTGAISFGGKVPAEAPIGTHSYLSLIYAMRSFNLKPSKDISNPVNDTRVAVFWETRSYIFTLRPAQAAEITLNGEKVSAQMISISTGVKELDALNLKVWLRTEDRVPLRITAGPYQADLVSATSNLF